MKVTRHVHRKPCSSQVRFHTSVQASIRERSQAKYSEVPDIPDTRPACLARCLKGAPHRVRAREPRIGAVHIFLCISLSGCWAQPPAQSCTISAWRQWAVGAHLEFMCLREYSDGTNPFISAKAVQLTTQYHTAGKLCSSSAAYHHRYCLTCQVLCTCVFVF